MDKTTPLELFHEYVEAAVWQFIAPQQSKKHENTTHLKSSSGCIKQEFAALVSLDVWETCMPQTIREINQHD